MAPSVCLYVDSLWISPYAFSSFVALREKAVEFSITEVSLIDGEHREPSYRARSLTARVPCLEFDGFALSESSAIAEYLDERVPSGCRLFPERTHDRARARQLMAWLRSDLAALREERSTVTMFYRFRLPPLTSRGESDGKKLLGIAEQVVPADGGSLFGDWALVDSELSFMLHRLLLNGYGLTDRVTRYAEREWQRPSVQVFVQHARPVEVPDRYWAYAGTPRPDAAAG